MAETKNRKRSALKAKLTSFATFLNQLEADSDTRASKQTELKNRLDKVEGIIGEFDAIQSQIEATTDNFESQLEERENFESLYYQLIAKGQDLVQNKTNASISNTPSHKTYNIQLPQIQLHTFNGTHENWLEFRDTYESLIHNNEILDPVQKFHYLRSALNGAAAEIIHNIKFTVENYKLAWELLCDRFNNTELLINNHVKALFNPPPVLKESAKDIRCLIDHVSKHLRSLKILKEPTEHWDTLVIHIVTEKLDRVTARQWEERKTDITPTLKNLTIFLNNRADLLEKLETRKIEQSKSKDSSKPKQNYSFVTSEPSCNNCKGSHHMFNCQEFLKLPIHSRIERVKQLKLCINCLKEGHIAKKCTSGNCRKCNAKHNSLLHMENDSVNQHRTVTLASQSNKESFQILLSTALAQVLDKDGFPHTCRAILDSGSQSHFISSKLCNKLGLTKIPIQSEIIGINKCVSPISHKCMITLQSLHYNFETTISCLILDTIADTLPNVPVNIEMLQIPPFIKLADPSFHTPGEVEMLIGASLFWDLLCIGQKHIGPDKPVLQKTKLGWIVAGNLGNDHSKIHCNFARTQNLENQLERFWKIEEVSSTMSMSIEDKQCEEIFINTVQRDDNGRFVVALPLKESPSKLGNSKVTALNRLATLEKKLQRDQLLSEAFTEIKTEYEELEHMTIDEDEAKDEPSFYLPHHGVFNHNSQTTKIRVTPIKSITVPRLELCGTLTLAQLVNKVITSSQLSFDKHYQWSDSTIALHWINTSPNVLQSFVSNRVSQIQTLTSPKEWHHIRSGDNPADILSRGTMPRDLLKNDLWWHGPSWLREPEENWPTSILTFNDNPPELKKRTQTFIATQESLYPFERFSSFQRLVRVTAYCCRFAKNCKSQKKERNIGSLTTEETSNALKILLKLCQRECFSGDLKALTKTKQVPQRSTLKRLLPFLDSDDLIKVGGRLQMSQLNYESKHPVILPHNHHLTTLIFRNEHIRLCHAGPQLLLSSIRNKFWPIRGRSLARKVVHRCIKCFKANPVDTSPPMGILPKERVTPTPPFTTTGVDYAGPFQIKNKTGRGCKISKCYICLFVCFSTKAVHLELVSELSKDAFIATFNRFISRRGIPAHMFSDNGRNFAAASKELTDLSKYLKHNQQHLINHLMTQGITWHFIPAYAPHFGGLWEAGVKSVKYHLRRVMGNIAFTFEHFYTILTQIESILNSRPLTPLSSDPNDLDVLTPAHFLIGKPLISLPEADVTAIPTRRLTIWKHLEQLKQHFWKRWSTEYITQLQVRQKWLSTKGNLQIGALVLIREDNLPPLQWRLGRVVEVHPGSDGIARVASIKTSSGIIKRAFSKICILPMDESEV